MGHDRRVQPLATKEPTMFTAPLESVPGLDSGEAPTQKVGAGVRHRTENGAPFVILTGRAMIEFDDEDSLVFVRRGSMCRLPTGAATRWTVSEPIEYLPVTEASVVFRDHDDERARGCTGGSGRRPGPPRAPLPAAQARFLTARSRGRCFGTIRAIHAQATPSDPDTRNATSGVGIGLLTRYL
jgi:hypothetical protein